ncbi:hypothetical protein FHS29_006522 [Saccharothrix tamanrassetensis]|uniref:Uncharacterized protein n=1 Tax=Saccharothrix tamanrassetensis TaxID=1051531 RepID=A0A841CRN0_9PSEU|nr:hypothetical protein [Saccharothrix tamanrassetensis]MBB5959900.1 hypothetical protein [Saccharothrix tamanrassetensis]
MDAKLAEELRLLLDAAAERAQPWLHKLAADGEHDTRTCGWCPLCNAVALVRGDRSELAARAAEHVAGLIAVLRAALAEPEDSASAAASASAESDPDAEGTAPTRPRVQHIPVVRSSRSEQQPC